MKRIPLTQGKVAVVSNQDYEWLNQWRWFFWNTWGGYAIANDIAYKRKTGKQKTIKMHRILAVRIWGEKLLKDKNIDHINRNGCDNRRSNLRLVSSSANAQNKKSYKGSTSNYKGVCWHKNAQKWHVSIQSNKKIRYLGVFENEIEAAEQYDKAALLLYDMPYLNFPEKRGKYLDAEFDIAERPRKNITSKYWGVYFYKKKNKWVANISFNGQTIYLGSFDNEIDAAKAYNVKAKELLGDKARLNFPAMLAV